MFTSALKCQHICVSYCVTRIKEWYKYRYTKSTRTALLSSIMFLVYCIQ